MKFPSISSLKTASALRAHLTSLGVDLPFDETLEVGPQAPLAQPCSHRTKTIGNRFSILPMEGWDGTADGRPSDLTRRRWRHFGESGAKLIWGGEAIAVRPDGRDNPSQLIINESTLADIAGLREELIKAHAERFGSTADLLIGLQLTHSGRFSKPKPLILYRHPYLDARFGVRDDGPLLSDDDIAKLVDDFIGAAKLAQRAGFAFVDIKHCHGYLGHEFLSAVDRPGRYGGSLENRTRFLAEIVAGMKAVAPNIEPAVRVATFDFLPFQPGPDRTGVPSAGPAHYPYAFGGDGTGLGIDLTEPLEFLSVCSKLGIRLICTSPGCPYYNPHIQRPAAFPPSDGYLPPEDPLIGVARQIQVTAELKKRYPQLLFVGSGYSYLQEWLPHVGQRVLRDGLADFVGIGRMVLAYPEFPADVLAGRPLARKRLCRTFSDCTTAPRNGMISGCYPLDPFYKDRPEAKTIGLIKHPPASTKESDTLQ
jgi:2,4-dienoyl-CoA reductase-like NADH-dependent reductase (Old Yellow Enzyme family)